MNTYFAWDTPWNDERVRNLDCQLIANAALEVERNTKNPFALGLMAELTAISVTCQGVIDVSLPFGLGITRPTSMYSGIISDSGERKSTLFDIFLVEILAFEAKQNVDYKERYLDWEIKNMIWEVKLKVLKGVLKENVKEKVPPELMQLVEDDIAALVRLKPQKPIKIQFIYQDVTTEAYIEHLDENYPSAGLISAEGGSILESPVWNDQSTQNSLWSSDIIKRNTKTAGNNELTNVRSSMSFAIPPDKLKEYLDKKRDTMRASGLAARCIICDTGTTQGTRFEKNIHYESVHVERFNTRLREILELNLQYINNPKLKRRVIYFHALAKERFINYYNQIEGEIVPGGRFEHARDHASKLPENIARIAALMHFFEGYDGDISVSTLESAIVIAEAASIDFMNWFVQPPEEEQDAKNLLQKLKRWNEDKGERFISKNEFYQQRPYCMRADENRFDIALNILYENGFIGFSKDAKTHKMYIDVCPNIPCYDSNLVRINSGRWAIN